MRRPFRIVISIVIALLLVAISIYAYFRGTLSPSVTQFVTFPQFDIPKTSPATTITPVSYKVEEFVQGLSVPWSIVFTNPQRMLVTERPGAIRVIQNGKLVSEPLIRFPETVSRSEDGLMGMALHPNYNKNKQIYVSLAYISEGKSYVKVERIVDTGTTAVRNKTIIDKIPSAQNHSGSRIKFGPDGLLYITTGDATNKELAQDKSSLAGKILRLTPEGDIPRDNPVPGSPIYSLGHRNPQGIDWHPKTGVMISVEHGPSGFDGPGGGDELNLIEKGSNYGWPRVSHQATSTEFVSPLVVWTPAIAPASGTFYTSSVFPQFTDNFFIGGLVGEGLFRVVFDATGKKIDSWEKLLDVKLGRIRDVTTGPDGAIYFSTSNTDGRGKVRSGDDKILRLVPMD